ncbi:MAG TPA: DUF3352 domain-containing protein [Thermoleophilaceae bacterium]
MRRRFLALVAVAIAAALAGCGGGGGSALSDSLAYIPKDTPFAVGIATDVNGTQYDNVNGIVKRFPFSDRIVESVKQQIKAQGLDYDKDLKPILGNEFVVGAVDARSFVGDGSNRFVGALKAKDSGKLEGLVKRDSKKIGEEHGATLYQGQNSTDVVAVKDGTLIVAGNRADLSAALARADGGSHVDASAFDSALDGLPEDSIVRGYFDVAKLLQSNPGSADARKVKWISALRTLGFTASAEKDAIDVDFNIKTDSSGLTDADLPLATGGAPAPVITRAGDIAIGLRNPAQVLKFAQSTAQAVNPRKFGDFETAKAQVGKQLRIDVDKDVIDQLNGDSSLIVSTDGKFAFRATPKNPATFAKMVTKVGKALPRIARTFGTKNIGVARPKKGESFYAVATPEGESYVFGVVKGEFVLANDPKRAGQLAAGTPQEVPGGRGSLTTGSDARAIARRLIDKAASGGRGGLAAGAFVQPLGQLVGWVTTSTSGMRGTLKLTFQ